MPKFVQTSCSQCGQSFGPGDSGFSHCDQHRAPRDLHIVIDRHGFVREQDASLSFATVIDDIIAGQFEDADKIIRITPPRAVWPSKQTIEDITRNVAMTIFARCYGHHDHITYNSAAYRLVEQHIGIADARKCLEQEAALEAAE